MVIAERITKRGTADRSMGGYKFVLVGDAADFIRRALGRRHVSMQPTDFVKLDHHEHATRSNNVMTTVESRMVWTLTDGDTGEVATIVTYGVGADTGDKYSGKVMTSNMKYAFLAGFQLSTGEDVENNDTSDRVADPVRNEARGGQAPGQGGRQTGGTQTQTQTIRELLRSANSLTTSKAIPILEAASGEKIEVGNDPSAAVAAFITAKLSSPAGGKFIHDLRKHVEAMQPAAKVDEPAAEEPAGGDSSPSAPAGEAPDEALEAGAEA